MDKKIVVCCIDGIDVFCEEDWTIMQAANSVKISIPSLCYNPYLTAVGSCRICVVEIDGSNLLWPACSTKVKDNMKISTQSEKVNYSRKVVTEMILSQHLADCLVCDASGECLLEKYAYEFGATGTLFEKATFNDKKHGELPENPLIKLDRTKCILCGQCVRACNEWVHRDALSFVDKGNMMRVSTLYDSSLDSNNECIFCGNCINVCPTGALWEKDSKGKGRLPFVEKIKSICPYCGVGCGIIAYKKNGEIIRVKGDIENPASKGRLCIKGKFGYDFINSKERLRKPLIKDEDGHFNEVSFLDALIYIKNKIDDVKNKNGVFAGLASARCSNEDNYLFQKFFRTILKSDNVDHCARICHSPSVAGLSMTIGEAAMTNPIEDIDSVDCFLVIGSNMTSTHPVISWKVINRIKQGALLILIDPKKSDLSKYATMHLQLNPGSDLSLLYAMIKLIIEENMHDIDYINERCNGFEEFLKELNKLDLGNLIKETGLEEMDIRLATRLYAISSSSSIYYAMGVTQHIFGTKNVVGLTDLALITGKIGKGPVGINPLRGQNNVQGACDMGCLPGILPGYKKIENSKDREYYENKWGEKLPTKKGLTLNEIMDNAKHGKIDFLYIMGENPFISDPDTNSIKEALDKVGFLVVQDIFLTETAEFADVILPACSFAEKEGTFTNTERRIQKINKIIDPISSDVNSDSQIILRLAELCGANWKYKGNIDIFNEIVDVVNIYSHFDYKELGKKEYFWPSNLLGESTKRLHQDGFSTEDKKANIIFMDPVYTPYKTDEEYPYLLIIGRFYEQYHTGTMTRKTKGIEKLKGEPLVFINPKDAIKLHLKNDDIVNIWSINGEITLKCKISLEVKVGNLYTTFHYVEAIANLLTSKDKLDDYSKMAGIKVVPVNLKRLIK